MSNSGKDFARKTAQKELSSFDLGKMEALFPEVFETPEQKTAMNTLLGSDGVLRSETFKGADIGRMFNDNKEAPGTIVVELAGMADNGPRVSMELGIKSYLFAPHVTQTNQNAEPLVGDSNRAICSCGSGVTACILAFALHQIGREREAVYDGSWCEWGLPSDLPVVSD